MVSMARHGGGEYDICAGLDRDDVYGVDDEDIDGDAYGGDQPDDGEDRQVAGSPLCIAQGIKEEKERQQNLCHLLGDLCIPEHLGKSKTQTGGRLILDIIILSHFA